VLFHQDHTHQTMIKMIKSAENVQKRSAKDVHSRDWKHVAVATALGARVR